MKQFWRNIFFIDRPAAGAWWGLCLGWGGAYLLLSLFLLLSAADCRTPVNGGPWLVIAALLCLYCWYLVLRFYFMAWRQKASAWWLLAIIAAASGGMIAINSVHPLIFGGWSAWIVMVLVLPLALAAVRRSWPMAAYALTSGICLCFTAWSVQLMVRHFNCACIDIIDPWRACSVFDGRVIESLWLQGRQWWQLAGLALAALAAGGWAFGRFLGIASQISFRQLYSKPVKVLLVVVLACYATGWVMAIGAQQAYRHQKTLLAQSFGRPVSGEALAQAYFGGRAPDAAYWETMRQNYQSLRVGLEQVAAIHWQSPENVVYSPEFARKIAGVLERHAKELAELDQMLQSPLPKYPLAITGSPLSGIWLPHISECLAVADVLLWQLRLAAECGDTATALTALNGLQHLAGYFEQEFCVVAANSGFMLERQYCRAVELLLESNMLTVADIDRILDRLKQSQHTLAGRRHLVLYGESVLALHLFESATQYDRLLTAGDKRQVNDMSSSDLRWVLPAVWYCYWHDLAGLAADYRRQNETDGLADVPSRPTGPLGYCWSTARFKVEDAYLSTMIGLLEIARYRLEYGTIPANMVLPLDPFTGKSLQYRVGEVTVAARQIPDDRQGSFYLPKQLRFEALQVWSVGLDCIDPWGNIRSMIRVK